MAQVLKDTNTTTDRDEAYRRAQNALGKDTKGMFRFNSGKQGKTFPDYNPYTISKCATCDIAKGKLKLSFIPESELCAACKLVRQINKGNNDWEVHRSIIASSRKSLEDWYKTNLPTQSIGNIKAKRFEVTASDGTDVIINRSFYNESISKYKTDPIYPIKLEYAKRVHELIKTATLIDPNEKSIDYPDAYFKVYETIDDCYRVEMKIRCNNDGNYMHILRVYKK